MSLFLAAMSSSSNDNVTQFVRLSDSFFDYAFTISKYKWGLNYEINPWMWYGWTKQVKPYIGARNEGPEGPRISSLSNFAM